MRCSLLPTVVLVGALTCGCTSEAGRAKESARQFLAAIHQGDARAAQAVATQAARPNIARMFTESQPNKAGFTLGEATIKDETAEVAVALQGESKGATPGVVLLRKEENQWRVWGLRLKADSGTELTLDLEHPERLVGEALGLALGELTKGLESLSKSAEKTGHAFGEALGGFVKGFTEGIEKTTPQPTDPLTPPIVR